MRTCRSKGWITSDFSGPSGCLLRKSVGLVHGQRGECYCTIMQCLRLGQASHTAQKSAQNIEIQYSGIICFTILLFLTLSGFFCFLSSVVEDVGFH